MPAPISEYLDFLPIFPEEDEDAVRARWDAWANDGLDPATAGDDWTDTREGSFFQIVTQPGVQEAARLYDRCTEVLAAAFPQYAWGDYLDDHAAARNLTRLAATAASGVVTFTGPVGTDVPPGTTVSSPPTGSDEDPPTFQTSVDAVIPAGGTVDVNVAATDAGSSGNVSAGALTVMETPIPGVTVSNALPMVGGTDPETDDALRVRVLDQFIERGSATADVYRSWARNYAGVGEATVVPLYFGPGTVLVVIATADGQPTSQSVVDGLQTELDPPAYETTLTADVAAGAVTLPVVSTAGAYADEGYVDLGDDVIHYTGRDATNFTGCSGVTVAHLNGDAVTQGGRGHGLAPIGHHVTVRTATVLAVTVAATIETEPGYSIDGFGGTIDVSAALNAAVAAYVQGVEPGTEVVLSQVSARLAETPGVHDVGGVTINGAAVNLPVPANPAQVPSLVALNLVAGDV